jgi:H+/Na+-translocating ferredoxin:NAD+ oxidoreductase subunit E
MSAKKPHTATDDLLRGVWRENPVLVQLLGLCPALAVTNSVVNGLAMGVATLAVIVCSNFLVSLFKHWIPGAIRISTYVLIVATFVTVVDMLLAMFLPEVQKALGAFVYLIVVNCMILSRQEVFASKQPVGRSVLDAAGTGFGFLIALLLMGAIREVIGSGTFLGFGLFGASYQPWTVMILPPGGFFTIGFILLVRNWLTERKARRSPTRRWPHDLSWERPAA